MPTKTCSDEQFNSSKACGTNKTTSLYSARGLLLTFVISWRKHPSSNKDEVIWPSERPQFNETIADEHTGWLHHCRPLFLHYNFRRWLGTCACACISNLDLVSAASQGFNQCLISTRMSVKFQISSLAERRLVWCPRGQPRNYQK